jgi:hypothetical protein
MNIENVVLFKAVLVAHVRSKNVVRLRQSSSRMFVAKNNSINLQNYTSVFLQGCVFKCRFHIKEEILRWVALVQQWPI